MFNAPTLSNIENAGFVVLLSLKAAVLWILVLDAPHAYFQERLPPLFVSTQACAMLEMKLNHDPYASTLSMTLAS